MTNSFINTRDSEAELQEAAKAYAKAQQGNWWTRLWSEIPMDIAEHTAGEPYNPLKDDAQEARRKHIAAKYNESRANGAPLSEADANAWNLLLNEGKY